MLFLVKPHLENSSLPRPGMGELWVAPPSAGLDDLRAPASLQAGTLNSLPLLQAKEAPDRLSSSLGAPEAPRSLRSRHPGEIQPQGVRVLVRGAP